MGLKMLLDTSHEHFMQQALQQARLAFDAGEIPVGAVVVQSGKIIARAYNQTEQLKDVTAHAEMLALTAAANYIGAKYLTGCTLYVTLEPCLMCGAALGWSQIGTIVYGAADPKKGFETLQPAAIHPKTKVVKGILEAECSQLVTAFFQRLR